MRLYLLDPETPGPEWAPFAGVRPVAQLRAGSLLIYQRWARALGLEVAGIVAGHCQGFMGEEPNAPPLLDLDSLEGPAWVVDATFVPHLDPIDSSAITTLVHQDRPVAWLLEEGARWTGPPGPGPSGTISGTMLSGTADLLDTLDLMGPDARFLGGSGPGDTAGLVLLGNPDNLSAADAELEPGVVVDLRSGPVILESGAVVQSGTRLEGPCYVGAGTRLLGGTLKGSSVGPACRMGGEVSACLLVGFSNKAHEGFLGHSIVGCWVNLGALTTTSNLKNTYGAVRLEVAGTTIETGRQFLGSLIGDHSKTAIGTMLQTGTVVGAGASVFGSNRPPRWVAPLSWGSAGELTNLEGFLEVASRVMPRRGVEWNAARADSLTRMYRRLAG